MQKPHDRGRQRPIGARPLGRFILCGAVFLLGAVAALRLPLQLLPTWTFPELRVVLSLPQEHDVDTLTRRHVLPLEAAVRAIGEVRGVVGEVSSSGASLRLRLRPGSDAARKAARLESDLDALRRELPEGGVVNVWPAGRNGGDRSAVLWIRDGEGSTAKPLELSVLETLTALPEVRGLTVVGEARSELRVTPRGNLSPELLERALLRHAEARSLGVVRAGGRSLEVLLRPPAGTLAGLPIRRGGTVVPLGALAEMALEPEPASWAAHIDGRSGRLLIVDREHDASPLALRRALLVTLERLGLSDRAEFLLDEAEPLVLLLRRLAMGLAAACVAMGLVGFWLAGWRAGLHLALAPPLAAAAALIGFQLAGLHLDLTTLPGLAVTLAAALTLPALRSTGLPLGGRFKIPIAVVWTLVAGAVLPIAVALAGGSLGPLLAAPSRAVLVTAVASALALWLLPLPPSPACSPRIARSARWTLRGAATVLLLGSTTLFLLLTLFHEALTPRPGRLTPALGDLVAELRFADGTTPAQAEERLALAERHLAGFDLVESTWSIFDKRWAAITVDVRPEARAKHRLQNLARRLESELGAMGAAVEVRPLAAGGRSSSEPMEFRTDLEDRAETDGETFYRFVLRSTELESLRRTHSRLLEAILQPQALYWRTVSRRSVRSDWGSPAARVELVPRAGASREEIRRATRTVLRRASPPRSRALAGGLDLRWRVTPRGAALDADSALTRAQLLAPGFSEDSGDEGGSIDPGAVFEARETVGSPVVKRQSGRFVLPVTVAMSPRWSSALEGSLNRFLSRFSLPPGVEVELPESNPTQWTPERLRMLAIASTFPALLFVLAGCRLNSIRGGLLALSPLLFGLAVAMPWVRSARGAVDELTLLALGAVLAGSLPLALEVAAGTSQGGRLGGGLAYRWLLRRSMPLAAGGAGMFALLVVPGIGLDPERQPWVLPLSAAALAGGAAFVASLTIAPAARRAVAYWKTRAARQERRRATVEAWREPGILRLETRNLTKSYGSFQALARVNLRLEPGIVGLLGPNGAGKTTLLRTLCGLLEPTRGQVLYRGVAITADNLPEYRRLVGFLPQDFNAYEGFTGEQFLDYWALERGLLDPAERRREIERRLDEVGLLDAAGRKVRQYSGGMRRRIGIARALLGDPPIVIVDEPTTGLDVESRNQLRESLLRVAGERVILFSTHIASDVAAAATRILVLDRGRLLFDGPALQLIARARGRIAELVVPDTELRDFSHRYRLTTRVRQLDGIRVRAVVPEGEAAPGRIVEPNLEEAYLALLGGGVWGRRERRIGSLLDLEAWRDA